MNIKRLMDLGSYRGLEEGEALTPQWLICIVLPEDDVLGDAKKHAWFSVGIAAGVLAVAALLSLLTAGQVARLMLHGSISHVQAAWTRLGVDGATLVLRSGADDLGGTLYDGRVLPEDGVEFGHELTVEAAERIARSLGRQLRLRTTTYGVAR